MALIVTTPSKEEPALASKVSPLAGTTDHIRVVPIKLPPELAPAKPAAAQLVYTGGPLLQAVEVYTIFWGQDWKTGTQASLAKEVNGFFDYILTSSLLDPQMSEYSVPGQTIGKGKHVGTSTITTPPPPPPGGTITDGEIQHFLKQCISTNIVPQPNKNSLYFVYLPSGVAVSAFGSQSCTGFCGYHDGISGGTEIYYAVMPYPGCPGCLGGLSPLDALTSTSSHELCEAITDPIPGKGWYDNNNGEIGDICAWQTRKLGNYMIQLEWSNKAGSCK
jgi:hypothetical protein